MQALFGADESRLADVPPSVPEPDTNQPGNFPKMKLGGRPHADW